MDRMFDYDSGLPLDMRMVGTRKHDVYSVSDITFLARKGQRRAASLVVPDGKGPSPVILYAHWYEPQACDSNRAVP